MEFLIDDRVIYRVEDNTLVCKNDPEQKITLTLTASRLLLLLLTHHGDVLPRDILFKRVWEDYGLDGSGNTLTQYISVLRRALHTLGVGGEAIVTVPRIGFMTSTDVTVRCLPDEHGILLSEAQEMAVVTAPAGADAAPELPESVRRRGHRHPGLPVFVMVPAILILLCFNVLQHKQSTYALSFVPVGNYQGCRVFTLQMYNHDRNRPSGPVMQAIIRASGLSCPPGGALYVHIDGNVASGDRGKIWVSTCARPQGNTGLQCRDYISNDWRMAL